ncbi:hypothetical protein [Plantactinospora sp. B5E13]|uniref:hypothetical protein n=1 Tax=unclassified Plantactinospora TaxID=2631981 RepID=UPI00325C9CCF
MDAFGPIADLSETARPTPAQMLEPYLPRPPAQQQRVITSLGRLVDDFGGTVAVDPRTTLAPGRAGRRAHAR